jgi:hypothetical protein
MEMDQLLERSRATAAFKADVRNFATSHLAAPKTITAARHAPRVKVLRVVAQLLHSHPAMSVERVHVDAVSGCSDFVGTLLVIADGTQHQVDFAWCCHWRAKQEGWTDAFGFPDQIRAAREFEWDCFERWEPRSAAPSLPTARPTHDVAVS